MFSNKRKKSVAVESPYYSCSGAVFAGNQGGEICANGDAGELFRLAHRFYIEIYQLIPYIKNQITTGGLARPGPLLLITGSRYRVIVTA
jgi:hypothetical protein